MANNPFSAFFDNGGNGDWGSMFNQSLLASMPQAAYYSSPSGQAFGAQSPRQGRYFQQAYQDVYGQYLGELGRSLREGTASTSFMDYLETDPWTRRYGQLPQYERGVTKSYTDPRTRFIFY